MNTFDQLISTFSSSGKEFELLCKWILETDPVYANKLVDVWMWADWPDRWADQIHEFDGHDIDGDPEDRKGEEILSNELHSLYIKNGIEEAHDDVSGAYLGLDLRYFFKNVRAIQEDKKPIE